MAASRITIILLLAYSYAFCQIKSDLDIDKLKGKVKSLKTIFFSYNVNHKEGMFLEKTSTDSVNYDKNGKIARKPTNIFKKKAKNNKELDPPSPQYEKGKVYDKNGNVIEYNSIDSYGNLGYVVKYKYNNLNYEIESISYNSNGNLIEKWDSKYELDKYQNWTKRMIYVNENFKYIIERKIKYY